ncbi:MAG: DUF1653 domain-containing protein [Candidatus Saccharimonadales bacterium]
MVTIRFDKLIRGAMLPMYEMLGQKAEFVVLRGDKLAAAIIKKIVEEAQEIPASGDIDKIITEIADVEQGLIDLKKLHGISDEQVETARLAKLAEKGGFSEGIFVHTLTLDEDDKWVSYYRNEPDKYEEMKVSGKDFDITTDNPLLPIGVYRHYKGMTYEIIGVGRHTESLEDYAVYTPLYEHDGLPDIWLRPLQMFMENVSFEGQSIPRFSKVD